ncbi:MAG: gliding motility-associated C-terminal domain-containing protein [Bacteroidales bacterium]
MNLTCVRLPVNFYGIVALVKSQSVVLKTIVLLSVLSLIGYAGETASASMNTKPELPPVAVCKNITVQLGSSGSVVINSTDIDGGSQDPDGAIVARSVFPNTFNCSLLGPNTVVLTVTDDEGLSSTCEAIVTVEDKTPPVINVKPFTLVLSPDGSGTLSASDIDNGSYDNCGEVSLSVSPTSFTCSYLGEQTVVLTATDSNGNSTSRNAIISVESTLNIAGMYLSSCDMSPTLALFDSDTEGGNGDYSYFWKGLVQESEPFMVIIPFPPSLQFSGTSINETPFFNNTMPNGYYGIRLLVTDGNGCVDSSEIYIDKTSAIFNNQTIMHSEACEGEVRTYSVYHKIDAVYSWSVINGTILNANHDTSRIEVRWNPGVIQGVITTNISEPNSLFTGGQCESTILDTVTITPIPSPLFDNPETIACANSELTYTLTDSYTYQNWAVTGGVITAGGSTFDNFVTVRWAEEQDGTVTVSVGHNSSCTGSVMLNVAISDLSGQLISSHDVTCNGASDGSASVAVNAGTGQPPYAYSLDGGAFQPGGVFAGIQIGNHYVTIRDASSCTVIVPFVINQPEPLLGSVTDLTDVICFGDDTGSVSVTASGGVPPYGYQLGSSPFQTNGTFGSLVAGNYSITIRDANNCDFIMPVTIDQPETAMTGTISAVAVSCYGESNGSLDLSVTGGTLPYAFLWSNGAATEDITGLPAGNYSVTITDSNGCTSVANSAIAQPAAALSGSIVSVTDVTEYGGNNGSVTVSGSGGTSPYQYSLDDGEFQSSGSFGSLSAGTYNLTIRDAGMCLYELTVTITQPTLPLSALVSDRQNISCNGGANGTVTVEGWGGSQPYLYSQGGGAFQSSGTFSSLPAGTYTITVKDAALDVFDIIIDIFQPDLLSVSVSGEDITCYGGLTGRVTATPAGGTQPYTYWWNSAPAQITAVATNLPAGTFTVTVTDANGCSATNSVTISQPVTDMEISIDQDNVTCNGGTNGSATAAVSGGLEPYSFSWNTIPEQAKENAADLPAGTYTITVTDSYGCIKTQTVTLTEPQPVTVNPTVTPTSCPDSEDGAVSLAIAGGTSPFTVLWSDGSTGVNRTGLTPGSYTAVITDHNNCGETVTAEVDFSFSFGCLVIPQVITPNNDGYNDVWQIRNIDLYPDAEVRVFNRWGKMVFSTSNLADNPWNGTVGGKLVPTDSYHYILYLNDGSKPRSGVISVIR